MRSPIFASIALVAAAAACAVKLNGTAFGGNGKPSSSDDEPHMPWDEDPKAPYHPQDPAPPPDKGCRAASYDTLWFQPPILSRPANPWQGVDGDKPAALPLRFSGLNANVAARNEGTCDAAHDHCLRECTWMIEHPGPGRRTRQLAPAHYQPDGTFAPAIGYQADRRRQVTFVEPGFTAYRTVPATKRLLRPGVKVAVQDGAKPADEVAAMNDWLMGTVDTVDWDAGTLTIVSETDTYQLSAARVVVLVFHDGGKVELLDGFSHDEIVVKPSEVILPRRGAE